MAKRYEFLKTTQGSRDGLAVTTFQRGEVHELDDALAEQFSHQGAVAETDKAVGGHPTEAESPDQSGEAGIPSATQRIEELVSVARDHYGLNVDSTMDPDAVRGMIETAKGGAHARETKVDAADETKAAGSESAGPDDADAAAQPASKAGGTKPARKQKR